MTFLLIVLIAFGMAFVPRITLFFVVCAMFGIGWGLLSAVFMVLWVIVVAAIAD